METFLYVNQIPKVIAGAVMSMYKGAKAEIRGENGGVDD